MRSLRAPLSIATALASAGCGGSLPEPGAAHPLANAFAEVPVPPPPARVEVVPERPHAPALWVDGAWVWDGAHWRWVDGGWFAAPAGYVYARWAVERRSDGTLLFAGPQWLDEHGAPVAPPPRLAPARAAGGRSDADTGTQ